MGRKLVAFYRKEFDTWDMGAAYKTAHLVDKGYLFGPEAIEKDALESPPQVGWVGIEEARKSIPSGNLVLRRYKNGEGARWIYSRVYEVNWEEDCYNEILIIEFLRLDTITPKEPRDE